VVLGMPRSVAPQRMLVAERRGTRAGLAVDEVTDVDDLPEADQETESDLLSGATLLDGSLVGVIDVDRLFDTLENTA
jgi:chemotaxis signal transduction protein